MLVTADPTLLTLPLNGAMGLRRVRSTTLNPRSPKCRSVASSPGVRWSGLLASGEREYGGGGDDADRRSHVSEPR